MQDTNTFVIQMKDVTYARGISWDTCTQTEVAGKREPDWLVPGSILFVARGSHNYAVLVDDRIAGRKVVAAPHFYLIKMDNKKVLPEFLVWWLNQAPCQRYFEQQAEGSVTKSIRRGLLEQAPLALPPLERQRIIVGLANKLRQEQQVINRIAANGEMMMHAIASDLLGEGGKQSNNNANFRSKQ